MNNRNNSSNSKTDVQEVKRQNALSQQGGMTEFASDYETDVQEVKRQNAQSEQKKNQNY